MDAKNKSIVIGLISAFAAVMIIIMLFFTISGINGSCSDNKAQSGNKDKSEVVSIDSDGNRVIIIDDEDEDGDESSDPSKSSSEEENDDNITQNC